MTLAYVYGGAKPLVKTAPGAARRPHRRAGEFTRREAPALFPCGTDAAYRRHVYYDQTPCEPCTKAHKDANAKYDALTPEERAARRAARPLAPCGTNSAFARHVKRDEPIDAACREARNEYQCDIRARKREALRASAEWWPCPCGHAWGTHTTRDGCGYGSRESNPKPACDCTKPPLVQTTTDKDTTK